MVYRNPVTRTALQRVVHSGDGLSFPAAFREYVESRGDEGKEPFETWREFVEAAVSQKGLGIRVKELLELCRSLEGAPVYAWMLDLLGMELKATAGQPKKGEKELLYYNNSSPIERGTALPYTIARLKRDHGELYIRVREGEMSANAAAVEAGFRKRMWQCEASVEGVCKLLAKLEGDALVEVREYFDALLAVTTSREELAESL